MKEGREGPTPHPASELRPAPTPAPGSMRKYQQLALALITVISLVAFLFYKHEYDRLRYTLEYLDTFGEHPDPGQVQAVDCSQSTLPRLATPPAQWLRLATDLQVYSAFWDDGEGGMAEPRIRVLAVTRSPALPPQELTCLVWFETEWEVVEGQCVVEGVPGRPHTPTSGPGEATVIFLVCAADDSRLMLSQLPHQLQLRLGSAAPSPPLFIHRVEQQRAAEGSTTVCVPPSPSPPSTLSVVEFVAYHHAVGVKQFVLYGPLLTPLARGLLDQYGDQLGLQFEEKLFTPAHDFPLSAGVARAVVEADCVYRHRHTRENVVVLRLDQLLLLPHLPPLQATLALLAPGRHARRELAQFHLTTQRVCLDQQHGLNQGHSLKLARPLIATAPAREEGVAILRPDLMAATALGGPSSSQHVSGVTAVVAQFVSCPVKGGSEQHLDTQHLPSHRRLVELVKASLIYRKWLVKS